MDNSTGNFTLSPLQAINLLNRNDFTIFIFSVAVLFGFPTHLYIIRCIISDTGSYISSRCFNLNQSVCEMFNSLNALIFLLLSLFSSLTVVSYFLQGFCITGRPLFDCLICVERYLAVVHPVMFLKFKPFRYKVMCSAVAWIITLISCLSMCSLFLMYLIELYMWFIFFQFLIFLSFQLFCCLAVLRVLKQSGPGERGREREEENHMKRRAFHLILITAVSMFITYTPQTITGFLIFTKQNYQTIQISWFLGSFCFIFAGFVQPVLYLYQTGKLCCL